MRGQVPDGVEDDVALGARHPGRRLVEEQHLRLPPEGDRELDEPLAAVGELRDAARGVVGQPERPQQLHRLVDDVAPPARRPEHGRSRADPLGDRDVDVLQHGQPAEQPVDLERPAEAELDALRLGDARDVPPLQQHRARAGGDGAGQEVHERGLAGAVGADERVARARLEAKVDVARGGDRAEGPAQRARLEQGHAHDVARGRRARRHSAAPIPRMPLRANSAMTTSSSPRPSCQAVG